MDEVRLGIGSSIAAAGNRVGQHPFTVMSPSEETLEVFGQADVLTRVSRNISQGDSCADRWKAMKVCKSGYGVVDEILGRTDRRWMN